MDMITLGKFKKLFEDQKRSLIRSFMDESDQFQVKPEDLADETDLTSSELEASMRMRLRNREALFLKKINEALVRIQDGTFGFCEQCEDDIELKRLEARPTATLCVSCKEDQERLEHVHIDGHKPKSLGRRIRLA